MTVWHYIRDYLPWLLSVVTLYQAWTAGNLARWSWAIGMFGQALWTLYSVAVWHATGPAAALGLMPLNVGLWVVYYRNHRNWKQL